MHDFVKFVTRLYVPETLESNAEIILSDAQAHQLRSVLRLASGAWIALFNGRDGEWVGQAAIDKRRASVTVTAQTRPQTAPPALWLAFAPIKPDRLAFLIEKATELGVARLLPIITARTQGGRLNIDKLAHAAREAAEQCERLDIPAIDQPRGLETFLKQGDAHNTLFLCAESGPAQPVASAFRAHSGPSTILVGPEGGFTEEEFALLRAQAFVKPVTLGSSILRAETAAIAALACWQALCNDRPNPPSW